MNFLRSVSSVGGWTIISRVTGYFRDLMLAHFIGVSSVSDAIALTIKLPAFFRRLFAEGAFHVSFLPIFSDLLEKKKKNAALGDPFSFANNAFSWLFLTVLALVLLVEWQMPAFIGLIFSGLHDKPETMDLVIRLGRISFPYILFISLASFFGSLLNAFGRFAFLAASHAIGNFFIIGFFCFFVASSNDYGKLFTWSLTLSGIVQWLCVFLACWYHGLRIQFCLPTLSPSMRQFLKRLGPGMLGIGVVQINMLIGFYFGSHLPSGGISYLYYADRLNQLPLSIVGISLSSVLLPILVRYIHSGQAVKANKIQNHAIRFAVSIACPLMTVTLCLALPIAAILFGHGRLTPYDVKEVARTISAFSVGIPAYIMIKIMNTRFFAEGEMRTPIYASLIGMVIDVALNLLLISLWAHIGIALAIGFSAWAQAFFLIMRLSKKQAWALNLASKKFLKKMVVICIVLGLFLMSARRWLPPFELLSLGKQLGYLLPLIFMGCILFIGLCWQMKVFSARQLRVVWRASS